MACFLVPAGEAIVTTIATKVVKAHEKNNVNDINKEEVSKITFSTKLGWLNKLLYGGSALLAFEHVWHGEVIPTFPFLTAVQSGETSEMLSEMGSAGVMMAVLTTAIWGAMLVASHIIEKRSSETENLDGEVAV